MASLNEAQKEADAVAAEEAAKKKAELDKQIKAKMEEDKKKATIDTKTELDEAKEMEHEMMALRDNTFAQQN